MFEAWACERPVVLSAKGEAVGVLNKAAAGVAVPPEDPRALADAIVSMAENRERTGELGRNGRRYVEAHYSRREQARKLEELLAEVAQGK